MKTKLSFATLFLLFNSIILAGGNIHLTNTGNDTLGVASHTMSMPIPEEESYINDIPFDTEAIAAGSYFMNLLKPEPEAYIDDIPFNTAEVVAMYNYTLLNIHPEEEAYIDDIPFDTSVIAAKYKLSDKGYAHQSVDSDCKD